MWGKKQTYITLWGHVSPQCSNDTHAQSIIVSPPSSMFLWHWKKLKTHRHPGDLFCKSNLKIWKQWYLTKLCKVKCLLWSGWATSLICLMLNNSGYIITSSVSDWRFTSPFLTGAIDPTQEELTHTAHVVSYFFPKKPFHQIASSGVCYRSCNYSYLIKLFFVRSAKKFFICSTGFSPLKYFAGSSWWSL